MDDARSTGRATHPSPLAVMVEIRAERLSHWLTVNFMPCKKCHLKENQPYDFNLSLIDCHPLS
jgi:hypothetical protein